MWGWWAVVYLGVVFLVGGLAFASVKHGKRYDDSLERYFEGQEQEPENHERL